MPKQTTCPFCGQLARGDRKFCPHCGTRLKSPLEDESVSFLEWHQFSWRQKWYWLPLRKKAELELLIGAAVACAVMGTCSVGFFVAALPDLPKTQSASGYANLLGVIGLMFAGVAVLYSQIRNKMKDEPKPGDYAEPEDEARK